MTFTKMQGLGNDFIVTDLFNNNLLLSNKQILEIGRILCNRHFFVGGDGFILISNSDIADLKMIIVNKDGSEANMCGNGLRCAGLYAYKRGLVMKKDMTFETKSGVRRVRILDDSVEGDMGKPVIGTNIDLDNKTFTLISMGNPHAITRVNNIYVDFEKIGKNISDKLDSNVEFIEVTDKNNINMRVYERGVGETLSCGTGASASTMFTYLNGLTDKSITVHMRGGKLDVSYEDDEHVYIKGPVEEVYNAAIDAKKVLKLVNNNLDSR
ncbi:MAG: diaminopimelate epimerase [Bacilli bacterium]|nr:diaminopimelate epimerase [Bacilli bacterium]